jgi:hypothetical protein
VVVDLATKEKGITCLNFLATNIACSLFQLIIHLVLVMIQFMLWFMSGQFIWHLSGDAQLGLNIAPFISWGTVFSGYAVVWFVFWWVLSAEQIKWFYWKVGFSTLPLLIALIMFNPKPDPMAMIPLSISEMKFQFSSVVTGIVLFPLYSIGLYKYVFRKHPKSIWRHTVYVCLFMIGIGSLLFLISWNIMPHIYKID